MTFQRLTLNLGILIGIVAFSFAVVSKVQANNRPQVRARVVFADGTPLVNADIYVVMLDRDFDASGYGGSGGTMRTDAEGYFVEVLQGDNEAQFYEIGVAYHGHLAKALPFILHEGQPEVHLLLTLDDDRVRIDRWEPDQVYATLEAFLNPPRVWAVNPANGHAYKRIYCHDVIDAIDLAAAEDAYLVSINDEAEDLWIHRLFEPDALWIGLSDVAEEGQWVWHSGEPVTYTNWETREKDGGNTEMKDYAISDWGGWQAIALGDEQTYSLKEAILEKDDVHSPRFDFPQQAERSFEQGVWAVNPGNGHAYIKIRCKSLEDANARAAAEGAHLVTINDEAEEKWLLGLFGNHLYWIGLSDTEKEGEWVWQNGEPLIYKNWGSKHSLPRSILSPEEKDNAVMTFVNGQWHAVGPGDLLWRMTKMTILEKPDVLNHPSAAEK